MGNFASLNNEASRRKTMKSKSIRHVIVLAAASLLIGLCLPTPSRALPSVYEGYDLFDTWPDGTMFDSVRWRGLPLSIFNFGGALGIQNVGATDTIIQRLAPAITVPGTFNLQVNALQLQSVLPMFGSDYGYITLDSGHASGGQININAGTFSSTLNVYYDLRDGGLNGSIMGNGMVTLTSTGLWSHDAPPDALTIPGVNYLLNGVDTSADFWPSGPGGPGTPFTESSTAGDQLEVGTTSVPDTTSTLALLLIPLGLFALAEARGKVARRACHGV
jgi:hypothetical protein